MRIDAEHNFKVENVLVNQGEGHWRLLPSAPSEPRSCWPHTDEVIRTCRCHMARWLLGGYNGLETRAEGSEDDLRPGSVPAASRPSLRVPKVPQCSDPLKAARSSVGRLYWPGCGRRGTMGMRAQEAADKLFRPPAGHVMKSGTMPGGTAATEELCVEHIHSTPGSTDRHDSPVDPCGGISCACEVADGLPRLLDTDHPPCQLDVRLLRHKASWINPVCVEQPLQDLCPQRPTVQKSGKHLVVDTLSPSGLSLLSHRDSLAETTLSERTVDVNCSSSAHGPVGKNGDFSLATEEQEVQPQHKSLLRNPKTVATSLSPKEDSARFESTHLTASADDGCGVLQVSPMTEKLSYSPVAREACKHDLDEFVTLELGECNDITESSRRPCNSLKSVTCEPEFSPAGLLARELFRGFWKSQVLLEVNSQLPVTLTAASSRVENEECAGEDFNSSVDATQEVMPKSRVPGAEDWVPPGFQIILSVHTPVRRDMAVVAQNFFCAGCGTPIQPSKYGACAAGLLRDNRVKIPRAGQCTTLEFVKRLRYCEYLGKYFCDNCHSAAESCIPARILMMWDFRKYQVSNFSKWLLDSIWHQPVFNLLGGHHSLYAKAKELDRVKDIQEQLFHIKKLLKTCRFAGSVLKEFGQVPSHLTDNCHLFSMDDLLRTKKGLLAPLLKDILKSSLAHVASCEGAGLAFTNSVSSLPDAPAVPGSQLGDSIWRTCPLQRHDSPDAFVQSALQ
ncbi:RUN and cysteine rich domain containing beclin 1 interacting protein like [Cricetulus griseus]